jgi:putative multiple sugar transport system permease protein
MNELKRLVRDNIRQYGMIFALIAILLFFNFYTEGVSMTPLNITNLVLQNAYILVLAIGMLLVILTGNIDLSVGSVAALIGAICAILIKKMDVHWIIASAIGLLLGAGIGAFQGYWIAYAKIPAFIVTLAGMLLFRGLTLVVLGGQTIGPFPEAFNLISAGFVPDIVEGAPFHIVTILVGVLGSAAYIYTVFKGRAKKKKNGFHINPLWIDIVSIGVLVLAINAFTITLARYKGFPNIFIILFILVASYTFITKKTKFGRHIYALGGNYNAAKLSGVSTEKTMLKVYMNMGMIAALSGLLYAARLNAATPKAGNLFELDAIAACFIGGASANGGVGTIIGAIVGGLVMGVINNGMSLAGLSIDWQQVVKGAVLLLAVWFDIATKSKNKL